MQQGGGREGGREGCTVGRDTYVCIYVCIHVYMYKVDVYMYRYKSTFSPEENVITFFSSSHQTFRWEKKTGMRADRENSFFEPNQ